MIIITYVIGVILGASLSISETFSTHVFENIYKKDSVSSTTITKLTHQKNRDDFPHNARLSVLGEVESGGVHAVPFYSQFNDITSPEWQRVGCGIADIAMLIEFHKPGSVSSVDELLQEGIAGDAYLDDAGWIHQGLIRIAEKRGLTGETYDFSYLGKEGALAQLERHLIDGPVIASVHYTLDPTNPIPHLIVVTGIEGDVVYYNDPAGESGNSSISVSKFLKAWKDRFITIRA